MKLVTAGAVLGEAGFGDFSMSKFASFRPSLIRTNNSEPAKGLGGQPLSYE